MTIVFASAPDQPLGDSPEVWVENQHGLLAALSPAQARELAEELKDAADYAEDGELHATDETHRTGTVRGNSGPHTVSAFCHDCKWVGPWRTGFLAAEQDGRDHEALA